MDFSKRILLFKKIYDTNPTSEEYSLKLGSLYELNRDYFKAIDCYKKFITANKNNNTNCVPFKASLGAIYKTLGQNEQSLYYYSEAIKDSPLNPSYYNELSDIYLRIKDTLSAIQHLNKSISIQPLQIKPYLSLLSIYLYSGDFTLANTIINKGYKINQNDFATLYWHTMFQKYVIKNPISDSTILSIKKNSGIIKQIEKIEEFDPKTGISFDENFNVVFKLEAKAAEIKKAISMYPYYDEFYKIYIQFVKDNNMNNDVNGYKIKYLLYSKLNPDLPFIEKYIK